MDAIRKYFPELTAAQEAQFAKLKSLYENWNSQINVISRKDMDDFYERHVLHSLAIAKVMPFKPGTTVLDVGTGGGFPGIPLAILFPDCQFTLVDSIGKKIKVVNEVKTALQLTNVTAIHARAEDINQQFDFIVSRAVTAMPKFLGWVKNKFRKKQINAFPNGILYLKGGDLTEEMQPVKNYYETYPISKFFLEEFFETKFVVYVQPQ
jgi:16S rRNA (guanine527-N7)-methyltransferase